MIPLAFTGLEAAINKVLRLDPDTLENLKTLEGKSIKVEISDWNISFFVLPYAQGLQLLSDYHEAPNTTVKGKLFDLMKIGAAGASTSALFDASITISGDTKTGEAIRDVFRELDIDWEEQLSKIVGDSLAHPMTKFFKKFIHFGKRSTQSFSENISEYLHYESRQLPPKNEVEQFIESVAKIRDDIDRMDARVQHLNTRNIK